MHIAPFKIERYFARYEFSVPYLLCSSDCEAMSVADLLALEAGAEAGLRDLWLGYTESQGSPGLRAEIAALYTQIQPNQVLVHSGAEEAIFTVMNVVLRAGDHIIVHTPCYQSLTEVARALGVDVTLWMAHERDGWALDVDFVRQNIRLNTRLIVVNCPHNPTGYVMPADAQQDLISVARAHGITVFSDEVYRLMEYDILPLPAACDLYENAISLGVMSKSFGLPGLRIGWIATRNKAIYEAVARFKDYTTICNSAPGEYLAEVALHQREAILGRNQAIIRHNLELLRDFFARHGDRFRWQPPKAGPIAFPALLGDVQIDNFCERLAEQAGVLLLPGTVYDDTENHFRMGFGRRNMPEALERLEAFLQYQT